MESPERFKSELTELLKKAIKVFCFNIGGQIKLYGTAPEIYDLKITDNDLLDGEHSVYCDIRLELNIKDRASDRCKIRIDYYIKGKGVYVKYPLMVESHSFSANVLAKAK